MPPRHRARSTPSLRRRALLSLAGAVLAAGLLLPAVGAPAHAEENPAEPAGTPAQTAEPTPSALPAEEAVVPGGVVHAEPDTVAQPEVAAAAAEPDHPQSPADATSEPDVEHSAEELADDTPPVFASTAPIAGTTYSTVEDLVVDYSCSDPESGIASCRLYDPQRDVEVAAGDRLRLPEGAYEWIGTAVNGAGKQTVVRIPFSLAYLGEDTTPPIVGHGQRPTTSGWTASKSVVFQAYDAESGVDKLFVMVGGHDLLWAQDRFLTIPLAEGENLLQYWAVDKFGNESEHKLLIVYADHTAPEVTIGEVGTPGPDGSRVLRVGEQALFTFAGSDAPSGVSSLTGSVPWGSTIDTSAPGRQTFTATAVDHAGNKTERTMTVIVRDPADPDVPTEPEEPSEPGPGEPQQPEQPVPADAGDGKHDAVTRMLDVSPEREVGETLASTGSDIPIPLLLATPIAFAGLGAGALLTSRRRSRAR